MNLGSPTARDNNNLSGINSGEELIDYLLRQGYDPNFIFGIAEILIDPENRHSIFRWLTDYATSEDIRIILGHIKRKGIVRLSVQHYGQIVNMLLTALNLSPLDHTLLSTRDCNE